MTDLLRDPDVLVALALVVVFPLLVIGAGELDERLRQRGSSLRPALATIRVWTVPLAAAWLLVVALFGAENGTLAIRIVLTGIVVSAASASLSIWKVLVQRYRDRPRPAGERGLPQLVLLLPRLAIALVAALLIVGSVWEVDLSSAAAAFGVGSLVVSFALQDTLSGLASGVLLLTDQPFRPGDWITADDIEGRVVDINWRSSRIEDRNGDLRIVPNSTLAGASIVNHDQPSPLHRVVVPVQVAYVNPPTLAKAMLLDAARATDGVLDDPAPSIVVVGIDDPLMSYEAHLWIDDFAIAPRVSSDFGSLVWYQSHRHEVPLPSPAYDLYVYDGAEAGSSPRVDRTELRRRLRSSPLLGELDEDEVDRLAVGASAGRYAAGEVIWTAEHGQGDLVVLTDGRARLVVGDGDAGTIDVAELGAGDLFGFVTPSSEWPGPPRVLAAGDCEIVVVDAETGAAVASRHPRLAAALTRLSSTRTRRIERLVELRRAADLEEGDS
ncbi:MAG: mechanosensitive ion channel domain-containing protein [Actinomycetota bacterium]